MERGAWRRTNTRPKVDGHVASLCHFTGRRAASGAAVAVETVCRELIALCCGGKFGTGVAGHLQQVGVVIDAAARMDVALWP